MSKPASYAQWSLEPYCIGMKLRALRTRKKLTLSRLAAETGLSTALLSKLETERMIPTLPTLAGICKVYGVGMGHFFCEPTRHTLSLTRKAHLEGTARAADAAKSTPLNAPTERPGLLPTMVELTAMPYMLDETGPDVCAFVYVLEGRAHLLTDGMKQILQAGDCVYLETRMPTALHSEEEERCRILLVRPGARRLPSVETREAN